MIWTLSAALALSPAMPRIDSQIRAGGGGGQLLADWLSATFNPLGTVIVLISSFLVSLLLATTFSFARTTEALGPRLRFVWVWYRQAVDWWEEQSRARARRRIEKKKAQATVVATPEPKQTIRSIKKRPPAEQQTLIPIDEPVVIEIAAVPPKNVNFPSPKLLLPPEGQIPVDEEALRERADLIEQKTKEFEVAGKVQQIHPGPVVTTFEFKPEPGIKYSKVTGLDQDLCLALEAESIRIYRIPGKSTVGIEVPNPERATITLRELIESSEYLGSKARLPLALGKDIAGRMVVTDLHPDAALADRRFDRHRQVGFNQFVDPLVVVPIEAGPRETHHDRSETIGIGSLPGHPASSGSGRNRAASCTECSEMGRS